jgi:hypothetical protein
MDWIAANAIPAEMIDLAPRRDTADKKLIHEAMDNFSCPAALSASNVDRAVASL